MMEHRLFMRIPVRVGAIAENGEIGRRRVRVRDVSPAGALLEMDPSNVRRNSPLELVVAERAGNVRHLYRLTGWVVYVTERGVGVEFDDSDPVACRNVFNVLSRRAAVDWSLGPEPAEDGVAQPPLSTAG